jgi:hypothetical protein
MRYIMTLLFLSLCGSAMAHQWTPTYPKLEPSYVNGALKATMTLFNSRQDVSYYEIGVFDADMKPVKFATAERIVQVGYLRRMKIDVFIREQDRNVAVYICSKSKLLKGEGTATLIASRICSKIK